MGVDDTMKLTLMRAVSTGALSIWLLSCGGPTEPEVPGLPVDGVWRSAVADVAETTLQLGTDGTARLVEADYAERSCRSSEGTWSVRDGRLDLRLTDGEPGSNARTFSYEVTSSRLVLTDASVTTTFSRATGVPACVSYGFGSWRGTLSARINDVPWTFTNVSVDTENIGGGRLALQACLDDATSCGPDNVVLVLQVNATAGSLAPGTYPLGDIGSGFYGLVNLFPGDPEFPGFDSLRLTPTGALTLTAIAEERIVATFEFRANERASNAPPAPDGSTFALVTEGVIDLEYR